MSSKILILVDYFYPGIKGVGPAKSIINIANDLFGLVDITVVTNGFDVDGRVYSSVEIQKFIFDINFKCIYIKNYFLYIYKLYKIIRSRQFNRIFFNSFFSFYYTFLALIIIKLMGSKSVLFLAPRGELFEEVINLKRKKKLIYIKLFNFLKLYKNIIFVASNQFELQCIKKLYPHTESIIISDGFDLSKSIVNINKVKNTGQLRLIFLSRIIPKKNLLFLINLFANYKNEVIFHIYGPIEDRVYFKTCLNAIKLCPPNIKVEYKGDVDASKVLETFSEYHLMVLPTLGENYGHVIAESLLAGTPVLISKNTPWISDLNNVVNIIDIDSPELWESKIDYFLNLNQDQYTEIIYRIEPHLKKVHIRNNYSSLIS